MRLRQAIRVREAGHHGQGELQGKQNDVTNQLPFFLPHLMYTSIL
jgi:hypothetical protein